MRRVGIGLIGLGTVGKSVADILKQSQEQIALRCGAWIEIKCAVVRDVKKYSGLNFPLSSNLDDILNDSSIEIVVELIGGVEYPFEIAKKVFAKKKAFVTANKAMLGFHFNELLQLSQGLGLGFEASVCGGLPIIEILRDCLGANDLHYFRGILNGTSNYVLTQMLTQKQELDSIVCKAQELGYAEADPSLDIKGIDAGQKLLILSKLAYGLELELEDIAIEGIEGITLQDLEFAKECGYCIRLLGIAEQDDQGLDLRVHLAWLKESEDLAQVNGVKNALCLQSNYAGDLFISGVGAGGFATASSVIADLIHLIKYPSISLPLRHLKSKLKPKGSFAYPYYLRLTLQDFQTLNVCLELLQKHGIIFTEIVQREQNVIILTQQVQEQQLQIVLKECESFLHSYLRIPIL